MSEAKVDLVNLIKNTYPELIDSDFSLHGSIELRDDADGEGAYIAIWSHEKPIPSGMKLGKQFNYS